MQLPEEFSLFSYNDEENSNENCLPEIPDSFLQFFQIGGLILQNMDENSASEFAETMSNFWTSVAASLLQESSEEEHKENTNNFGDEIQN